MQYEEYGEFERNISDYQNKIWFLQSEKEKIELMKETNKLTFEGYGQMHGVDLSDRYHEPMIRFDQQYDGGGYYNFRSNEIVIGNRSKTKYKNCSTTFHESVHQAQDELAFADRSGMTQEQIDHCDMLKSQEFHKQTSTFGIENNGRVYVVSEINGETSERAALRDTFYRSQYIEREAHALQLDFERSINHHVSSQKIDIEFGINNQRVCMENMKNIYVECAFNRMSDEQIYQLIDKAQQNVFNGTIPSNNLEASVTYDFATMLYPQNKQWNASVYEWMTSVEGKSMAMEQAGFHHTNTVPLNQMDKYSLGDITSMSGIARDQNPILMYNAVKKYGQEAVHLINKDSFDEWYFSDQNLLNDEGKELIAEYMGPEYAPEYQEIGDHQELDDVSVEEINAEEFTIDENQEISFEENDIDMDELCAEENQEVDMDELCAEENQEIDMDELCMEDGVNIGENGIELGNGANVGIGGNAGFGGDVSGGAGAADLEMDVDIGGGMGAVMQLAGQVLNAAMQEMEREMSR